MKLYVKQHVLSIRDRFDVKDEYGTTLYSVHGSILTIGRKFTIADATQTPVATVKHKPFHFLSQYIISTADHNVLLKRDLSLFKMKFSLKHLDWKLSGDYLGHRYNITSHNKTLMTLSKKWFSWGDSYELNIHDDNNALLCLCITIAIDAELANSRRAAQTAQSSNT